MKLYFLEAPMPLTKSYEKLSDGSIKKTSYPNAYEVTSHEEDVSTLSDFEAALKHHAAQGHCMLKGKLTKALVKESRAGSTVSNDMTEWVCFDLDGLPAGTTPDSFLIDIGITDVSYILHYSASQGITDSNLHAHLYMLIDKGTSAPLLKQWLIDTNHRVPMLSASMTLTKTGNAIHWPLDISACQNDKLIYIATPNCKGLKDPFAKTSRIKLIRRAKDRLSIKGTIASTAKNRERTTKRTDELREQEGLPKRKTSYRMVGSMEVMVKPDSCTVTSMKVERGFVYLNLNDGDSWGYYHPENNPDYIHNFKGEPVYLTKELLPDYWDQITNSVKISSTGLVYLAFCDRKTSTYWRGTYDQTNDELDINQAKNETQVRHFAKQHGVPLGDFIPEWDLIFDPQSTTRVDIQNKMVNSFQLSPYMKATPKKVGACPKTIYKILDHALGGDAPTIDHFINWLAFILQKRDRTTTSWVLHGTQGTGKGLLFNNVIRPLFGRTQTTMRRMEELDERYNSFMKDQLIVCIDEIEMKGLQNELSVIGKLKNFISEEYVPIRAMHAVGVDRRNYCNYIFFSNASDPVYIPRNDRRTNVGKYQPAKIQITDKEIQRLEQELQSFHDFLFHYAVDEAKAREVLLSSDRTTMIQISESSIDTVAGAMLDGDFEFFVDQMPTTQAFRNDAQMSTMVDIYRTVLLDLLSRTDLTTGICNISREELRTIFEYTVGVSKAASTPNKFTSLLKHHRIVMGKVWIKPTTVNGIRITWKDVSQWPKFKQTLNPGPITPAKQTGFVRRVK